jgi:DNA-binding response OmpR family regulator
MPKKSVRNKTVLVIEDERPLVLAIQTKLEKNGFDVATARTVEQGLNYIEDIGTIDAIWLDHYLLGGTTGLDFVSKIKLSKGEMSKVPIFVVSNTASSHNVQSYMRLGVSKYCVKAESRLDGIVQDLKTFLENPED